MQKHMQEYRRKGDSWTLRKPIEKIGVLLEMREAMQAYATEVARIHAKRMNGETVEIIKLWD